MNAADFAEKIRRYPIPVVSGAIVILCLLVTYLRIDLSADLEARRNDMQDQSRQVDDNVRNGAKLAVDVEEMRTRFAALDQRVVQPSELATNKNYFFQLESNTGVRLGELQQHASSDKPVPKNKLGGVGYTVTLSGTFAQVVASFNELENGHRFYRLKTFAVERGRDGDQAAVQLSLNFELLGWIP